MQMKPGGDFRRSGQSPLVGFVVAVALVVPGRRASASPADDVVQVSIDRLADARRRIDEGEPDAAIELLNRALTALPDEPGYRSLRARILLEIVEAERDGFVSDGRIERLRAAKRLLDGFLGPLELLDEQGRADVEARRGRLLDEIAGIEAARRHADAERAAAARREQVARLRSEARALTVAGTVTTSLGLAGLALMATGLGIGRSSEDRIRAAGGVCPETMQNCEEPYPSIMELRQRGNRGNVLAVAGAVAGGALLLGGLGLLAVARKKSRRAGALAASPAPIIGRGVIGLAIVAHF